MSDFLEDLELFKSRLRQDGETDAGIEDVLSWFRECWKDDRRDWVIWYVKQEADFQRELHAMGANVTERIKASMKMKAAA